MIDRPVRHEFFGEECKSESVRKGFGRGLVQAGRHDERVVALSADLTESVAMDGFANEFAERFIQVGVAEQNLVTVASGLARAGNIPFVGSYAAFSPGRNWEQIRTTVCLNDLPVKIIGSHAGLTVGPDGATHQMLEDIALMRSLPNTMVFAPGDSVEAAKITEAMAQTNTPCYMRLARNSTPIFTYEDADFAIGQAYRMWGGNDLTIISTGTMTATAIRTAELLQQNGISPEVLHVPTIKPLDETSVLESVAKTGRVVTLEEAQIAGGLGGAVAELLSEKHPAPLLRLGVRDTFGESGSADELLKKHRLDVHSVVEDITRSIGAF